MNELTTDIPASEREGLPTTLAPISKMQRWFSDLVLLPAAAITTAAFGSFALMVSVFDKGGHLQHWTAHFWAKTMLAVTGAPLTIIGEDRPGTHAVAVYASNHLSFMDTPAVFASLPFQFRILARHNLWTWPFIGWWLNRSGQIPANADTPRASITSLTVGVKALKSGMPLMVFPEGGRSLDGSLQEFMSGPAFMAIRAQVPLVPIAIIGTRELLPMHSRFFRPHPVKVIVGEALSTDGLTTRDANELTAQLRQRIAELCANGKARA